MRKSWSNFLELFLPFSGVFCGVALVAIPLISTITSSFSYKYPDGIRFSLENFYRLIFDPRFYDAISNTLLCAVGTTIISCVLGVILAWLVTRTDMPGRSWFEISNLIPFFLSPYVGAISWIYLIAPNSGILQNLIKDNFSLSVDFLNIYSLTGVIWVLSLFYTPYVYLFIVGPLRHMDATLEDVARVHGASFIKSTVKITIPLLMPAILSAACIVLITSGGLFDVPLALTTPSGIRTMPTEIFTSTQYPSDIGRASAFSFLVLIVTIFLAWIQRSLISTRRFDTISGKGYKPRIIRLSRVGKFSAVIFELAYLISAVLLPLIALVAVSLSPFWTGRIPWKSYTFSNFEYVLLKYELSQQAIGNSLFIALIGATICVAISFLQGYYLHRGGGKYRGLLDTILFLPIGIPGIILGLGFLIAGISTPLYGTFSIIIIAYIAHFFPFATRTISAMFLATNPELELMARTSGANWIQTMRYILLPLLRPAIVSAWLMLFVIFIRELGATILLYAQGTETISVALVLLSERSSGHVAALAIIQLFLLIVAFCVFKISRPSSI